MKLIEEFKQHLSHSHPHQSEFHDSVLEIFEDVIEYSDYNQDQIKNFFYRIIEPDRTLSFKVEWVNDEGKVEVNRGYRVQFNNNLGPYKGGLRFHPSVNESILKFLAFEQIFKNAMLSTTMGGAKGGSDFNPKGKSDFEIQRFCAAYMQELHKYLGSKKDIPAGDIGVGEREIGYLYGQFLRLTDNYTGVLSGKGPNFGGSCGRVEATGHGCVYMLQSVVKYLGWDWKDQNFLISGSGNVALHTAKKLVSLGAKVHALSDSGGTLVSKEGFSQEEMAKIKGFKIDEGGRLKNLDLPGSDFKKDQSPWDLDMASVSIAIPCATQNEINLKQAERLINNGCRVFCEGANMPLTSDAQNLLRRKGIVYLPGKIANAGGVAVSGMEISQNLSHTTRTFEQVDNDLKDEMNNIFNKTKEKAPIEDGTPNFRAGANLYAYDKIYRVHMALYGS